MPIKIKCTACSNKLTVPDSYAGKRGKCPKCDAQIRIPAKSEPEDKATIQVGEPENQQEAVSGIPSFADQDAGADLSAPSISMGSLAAPSTPAPDISASPAPQSENPFAVTPKKKGRKIQKPSKASNVSGGSAETTSRMLKQVGLLSVATTLGIVYGTIGLIGGILFAVFTILVTVAGGNTEVMAYGLGSALGVVIFAPLFYGAIGFIFGLLMAALYNIAAKFTGGIQMKFDS